MRKPIIAGNWKMNLTWAGAVQLSQEVSNRFWENDRVELVICPPFTTLKAVSNVLAFDHSDIKLGAQNVYEENPEGITASTGEISAAMLDDLDCKYCIVGHSERRELVGETDIKINKKVKTLLNANISPIVCCGESLDVYEAGRTIEHVVAQIRIALSGIESSDFKSLAIAYEPIWAIGSGCTPIPENANDVCGAIRNYVFDEYGDEAAQNVRVLYGGSMKPENAEHFLTQIDIDGGLIGGASLDSKSFTEIAKIAENVKK